MPTLSFYEQVRMPFTLSSGDTNYRGQFALGEQVSFDYGDTYPLVVTGSFTTGSIDADVELTIPLNTFLVSAAASNPLGSPAVASTATVDVVAPATGAHITVNGLVYTAVMSLTPTPPSFNKTAAGFAAAINATYGGTPNPDVSATVSGDRVTLTARTAGVGGDDITLSTDSGAITLSGGNLSGGVDETYDFTYATGAYTCGVDSLALTASVEGCAGNLIQFIVDYPAGADRPTAQARSVDLDYASDGITRLVTYHPQIMGGTKPARVLMGTAPLIVDWDSANPGTLNDGACSANCTATLTLTYKELGGTLVTHVVTTALLSGDTMEVWLGKLAAALNSNTSVSALVTATVTPTYLTVTGKNIGEVDTLNLTLSTSTEANVHFQTSVLHNGEWPSSPDSTIDMASAIGEFDSITDVLTAVSTGSTPRYASAVLRVAGVSEVFTVTANVSDESGNDLSVEIAAPQYCDFPSVEVVGGTHIVFHPSLSHWYLMSGGGIVGSGDMGAQDMFPSVVDGLTEWSADGWTIRELREQEYPASSGLYVWTGYALYMGVTMVFRTPAYTLGTGDPGPTKIPLWLITTWEPTEYAYGEIKLDPAPTSLTYLADVCAAAVDTGEAGTLITADGGSSGSFILGPSASVSLSGGGGYMPAVQDDTIPLSGGYSATVTSGTGRYANDPERSPEASQKMVALVVRVTPLEAAIPWQGEIALDGLVIGQLSTGWSSLTREGGDEIPVPNQITIMSPNLSLASTSSFTITEVNRDTGKRGSNVRIDWALLSVPE